MPRRKKPTTAELGIMRAVNAEIRRRAVETVLYMIRQGAYELGRRITFFRPPQFLIQPAIWSALTHPVYILKFTCECGWHTPSYFYYISHLIEHQKEVKKQLRRDEKTRGSKQ